MSDIDPTIQDVEAFKAIEAGDRATGYRMMGRWFCLDQGLAPAQGRGRLGHHRHGRTIRPPLPVIGRCRGQSLLGFWCKFGAARSGRLIILLRIGC